MYGEIGWLRKRLAEMRAHSLANSNAFSEQAHIEQASHCEKGVHILNKHKKIKSERQPFDDVQIAY